MPLSQTSKPCRSVVQSERREASSSFLLAAPAASQPDLHLALGARFRHIHNFFHSSKMSEFDLDAFLRDCPTSTDPTGPVWGSTRPLLMQLHADPTNANINLPLVNVFSLPADFPSHQLPHQCSPLDGAEGEPWAFMEVIPSPGNTHQLDRFANIDEFRQQWDAVTNGFLNFVDFKGNGAIVAGGLVETCLLSLEGSNVEYNIESGGRGSGDVDIFFHGHETWESLCAAATTVALQVIRGMEEAGANHVGVKRRKKTLNITAYNEGPLEYSDVEPVGMRRAQYSNRWGKQVQLVLHHECSLAHILARFDLDSCQFAYDGGDVVWATPLALRARAFKANLLDIEKLQAGQGDLSKMYSNGMCNDRIVKYTKRGYGVVVPLRGDSVGMAAADAFLEATVGERWSRSGLADLLHE